ncbi:MAG: permease-like cell division protein FtsX [Dysgonamonadaceae bacterium]|jgi:cell division transport system permease protein|nr:permease-like cell division protein FtsX [Dysgonamonadaceae bacterium]
MAKKNKHVFFTFINSRLTSTISISLVLFLFGVVVLLGLFANSLSVYVKENLSFSIVLNDDMKNSQVLNLQKKLETSPYVKSSVFISKEQALKELEKELGENPETFLGYNPLLPSIEVKLNSAYANNDSIAVIETKIRQETNIRDVLYRKDLLQAVNDNVRQIGLILLVFSIALLLISFALINNTIRLSVYSKRFLIHTMKLVGATGSFIRKPFIYSNIVIGVIAAITAMSLLTGLLYYLSMGITDLIGLIDLNMLLVIFAVLIALGILISVTATYFAVNRYLKMEFDKLHYV